MNLAYRYPIMFWNCACLINDAGGDDTNEEIDEEAIEENTVEETYSNEMEEFNSEEDDEDDEYDEDEDCDGYPATIKVLPSGKKKKKVKATNYGRIAAAIGKIMATGVRVVSPDINQSTFTFSPDIEHNAIRYGLSGITRVGNDLVKTIIANRPYASINDFLAKVKVNKPQMINLIKCGAFDAFGERTEIMHQYIDLVSDTKKRITLQNMKMLIDFNLIPEEYQLQCRVYNFSKYLKKINKDFSKTLYLLDNIAFNFYAENCNIDRLIADERAESGFAIKADTWDKIYQSHMDIVRPFIQKNASELLIKVNTKLTEDTWNKYCLGSISKWEMDSISCYIHEHELATIRNQDYGFSDYNRLSETPEIDRYYPIKGKMIPIFALKRIAGTVLDRDKSKKTVTLLTTTGVVTVKIYGGVFAVYDKQISIRGDDGKKHIVEKSSFSRGNKIIVTGIRDGDAFLAKTYKSTPYHRVEIIDSIEDGHITTRIRSDEV